MFAYCANNPANNSDQSGFLPNIRIQFGANPILYDEPDPSISYIHIPSPDWGELWSYSNSLLDSGTEDTGVPLRLKVASLDVSILGATNDGFDIIAVDASYLTMMPYYKHYVLPAIKYMTASIGAGAKNNQIYADALIAILGASYDFCVGPFDITLTGYSGGAGVRASFGLTGFSFHFAKNIGLGISVSWQI